VPTGHVEEIRRNRASPFPCCSSVGEQNPFRQIRSFSCYRWKPVELIHVARWMIQF
jgi:hypothetical protein